MKVKFANAEVDVWKLRKGVVLALSGSGDIVHLKYLIANIHIGETQIVCEHFDRADRCFGSDYYVWLEPHD